MYAFLIIVALMFSGLWIHGILEYNQSLRDLDRWKHKTLDANERADSYWNELLEARKAFCDLLSRTAVNSEFFVCGECRKIVQGVCLDCLVKGTPPDEIHTTQ